MKYSLITILAAAVSAQNVQEVGNNMGKLANKVTGGIANVMTDIGGGATQLADAFNSGVNTPSASAASQAAASSGDVTQINEGTASASADVADASASSGSDANASAASGSASGAASGSASGAASGSARSGSSRSGSASRSGLGADSDDDSSSHVASYTFLLSLSALAVSVY